MSSQQLRVVPIKHDLFWSRVPHAQFRNSIVCVGKEEWYLPHSLVDEVENRIQTFKVRDSDVWVATFPRTGTTWTQEMAWCILNKCDFDTAKSIRLAVRSPFLEFSSLLAPLPEFQQRDTVAMAEALKSPRLIKTHLPVPLLPQELQTVLRSKEAMKTKVIFTFRDPKSTCVSYFHHAKAAFGFSGSMEEFVKAFTADSVIYAPFWKFVQSYWDLRNSPNLLFLKYEDMKKDLPAVVLKTAAFLGKHVSPATLPHLVDHLDFNSMKNNASFSREKGVKNFTKVDGNFATSSAFIRKGELDSWKDELSPEMIQKIDSWSSACGIPELV